MQKRTRKHKKQKFWDKEYAQKSHLALSADPSGDLLKFLRWLERRGGHAQLNQTSTVLDVGCGNGRNLVHMSKEFGMRGVGIDNSSEAVRQAKELSAELPLKYHVRSAAEALPMADSSCTFVLDMMASHVLSEKDRKNLLREIVRVLKPGGWLFFKTFLLDEDRHAKRLLREHPGGEKGSYVHPKIGIEEHVFTEEEISEMLSENFEIHKVQRSHKHLRGNKAFKRRNMSVYAEKIG